MSALSDSEMAKYYQLQRVPRDADACAVAVITAWWTKLRRTSGDLKDLDKVGIDLETSLPVITLAPLPVDLVVTVLLAPWRPSTLPARLARATLPHHSLPFWSNFILSLK